MVSLPVPAVVGTAIRSGSLCVDFEDSFHFVRDDLFGQAMRAPTALAQSMLEPPPKPMMAWQSLD